MCLSTIYKLESDGSRQLLAEDIAAVRFVDGKLVFYDIMGVSTETDAQIEQINLMDNFIYVK